MERVHCIVELTNRHTVTGRTIHRHGDTVLPPPAVLKIVQYDDDGGYYLLRLSANGQEITDTLHDTINNAKEQARFEYQVSPNDWVHP
jgi:hypothetical protein